MSTTPRPPPACVPTRVVRDETTGGQWIEHLEWLRRLVWRVSTAEYAGMGYEPRCNPMSVHHEPGGNSVVLLEWIPVVKRVEHCPSTGMSALLSLIEPRR